MFTDLLRSQVNVPSCTASSGYQDDSVAFPFYGFVFRIGSHLVGEGKEVSSRVVSDDDIWVIALCAVCGQRSCLFNKLVFLATPVQAIIRRVDTQSVPIVVDEPIAILRVKDFRPFSFSARESDALGCSVREIRAVCEVDGSITRSEWTGIPPNSMFGWRFAQSVRG